ncbi:SCO family protein [Bacillus sp. 2205SS5-2]|uniref:SCO family protein n=1 Tax=Bacillus sp. 2205SS5-2 TaxID=3109031 RepID=UPI003003F7A9
MISTFKKISIITIACLFFLAGCSNGDFHPDMKKTINDFSVTDQNGEAFKREDLNGKVTLSDFIFTNCTTVCPPMTFNMAKIQDMLVKDDVTNFQIASFSVDPAVDSPDILKEYISKYDANEDSWRLLTGYDQAWVSQLALESFQTIVQDDPESDQVIHATRFYLIDQNGTIVKSYRGDDEVEFDLIVSDVKQLIKSGPVDVD